MTLTATGSSAFDNTVDIYGYSPGEATVEVQGAGSSLSAGFVRVGEPLLGPLGGALDGNGTLDVRNGGHVNANYLLVNTGGTLKLQNATLTATGYGPGSGSDLGVKFVGSTLRLAGKNESLITADAMEIEDSEISFLVVNSSAPTLRLEIDRVSVSSSTLVVVGGSNAFEQGDRFTLIESDIGALGGFYTDHSGLALSLEKPSGQAHSDLDYAVFENLGDSHSFGFVALTDGHGLGSSDLRFVKSSSDGVTFKYDGQRGFGEGGGFERILTTRVDRVFGSNQDDELSVSGADVISLVGFDGNDFLEGGAGSDVLNGGHGNDRLHGGEGNDRLLGGEGNDRLHGDEGNDRLLGGDGSDRLYGGTGNDRLEGGVGDDVLAGNSGADRLIGEAGRDTFIFRKGFDSDRVLDFEDGVDDLFLDDNLWSGSLSAVDVIDVFGRQVGSDAVLTFNEGDVLRLENVQLTDLSGDLTII